MRSVIMKPLTILVIEAATAIVPRTVVRVVCCSPATRMSPDDGNRGNRVRQGHERSVQKARHVLDDLETDEGRQNEDERH